MTDWDLSGMLRRIRRVADLSQRELARRLGISKSSVAAMESGSAGLDARQLAVAAEIAGLRLTLVDAHGAEVVGMAADTARDGSGRRFPAHLDVLLADEWGWGEHRRDRPVPTYTTQRDRRRRDSVRGTRGTPRDHPVPRPGDSPAARRAARQDALRREQRAEWERRRDAGELPPLPDLVCECPPACAEGDDGTRPFHTDGCVCSCDVG